MANLKAIGGILQPLQKFQFCIIFGGEHIYEEQCILTQQVLRCSVDLKNKIFKVTLRQPLVGNMITMINFIIKSKISIYIEPMDTGNNADFAIHLYHCECLKHNFELDYSSGDMSTHELEFKYDSVSEIEPVAWEELAKKVKEGLVDSE